VAFGKFVAATVSAALIATPTMAAASRTASIADARVAEASAEENALFGDGKEFSLAALIGVLLVIGVGIYIVLDDEEDEDPVSP